MLHHGSSALDVFFLDVKQGVDEMIEFLANEPSTGLFFVQQHAQTSMPFLLNVEQKVGEKIHEVTLHTEDIEDSICSVRSMTEYGIPIADEMIKDINRSLLIMSASQPKRGLILNPSWSFATSNSSTSSIGSDQHGGSSRGYLSAMFDSAKQKAAVFRWSQPDAIIGTNGDRLLSVTPLQVIDHSTPSTPDTEGDELPLSSQLLEQQLDDTAPNNRNVQDMPPAMLRDFDKFKSERVAKFEEWLQEHRV